MAALVESVHPPMGIVNLCDKQQPVYTKPQPYDEYHAFTRGIVDINGFQNFLRSMPSEVWNDETQEGNVKLVRPAHDAWGVKKIIFTFCDDFLTKVYDLPWSRDPKWKQFLDPIFAEIGVNEKKIVRCLLASMPPGMQIPVHHDTGYWVKCTHRVHCAIETADDVDFMVGPTVDNLKKYWFQPGHIIELNNQAKHSVHNKTSDVWRVHLIFDYVDDDFELPERILLEPGQKVNQTRRSIDLACTEGSSKSPSYLIIGAQKSGTTSLYELIQQHPLAIKGKRRETHFFDWRWNHSLTKPEEQLEYYMNFYEKAALHKHPSLFTGESTPSYLLHSDCVIPRVLAVCPWVKILVILRNPVDRAFSQFQMCTDISGSPEQMKTRGLSSYIGKDFATVVREEIAELEAVGIDESCSYDHFKSVFLSNRPMNHGGHSIVGRGLYALQLIPWLEAFASKQQIQVHSIARIKGPQQNIQAFMENIYRFVGLPPQHELEEEAFSPKNTRAYDPLSSEVREILSNFYAPHNRKLSQLLVEYFGEDCITSNW